jgi:bifunctional non-homologous end joining protein LigD
MPAMPIEFCLPKSGKAVPNGPDWLHEIKYDGYRLRVERHGCLDWTRRFPWIAETARKIRQRQFIIDGEAVVLGVDGISDFDALHSRKHDHEVQLYAFDCLAYDGDDLSRLPLHLRKTNLAQLLRGRAEGIFVPPFERGEIGAERAADLVRPFAKSSSVEVRIASMVKMVLTSLYSRPGYVLRLRSG